MKIKSLIRENDRLIPVEVELSFLPGLPQIQFLGLPDQAIKESIYRIKSAIRSQGFEFPKAQQILVNLRPSHLKKTSRGLELAVALGILWETQQIPPIEDDEVLIYGELSLNGEVFEPDDLCQDFSVSSQAVVWTGHGHTVAPFKRLKLGRLQDASSPEYLPAQEKHYHIERPSFGLDLEFPKRQAEIIKLVSLGEHSLMLAGPAGSGKSTLAKTIWSFTQKPTVAEIQEINQNNKGFLKEELRWRPLVNPHHSTTPLGLIGGGVPPCKGEISRAHRGVLVLDELLEFQTRAQEALREPMEEFKIRIRRGRFMEEYAAETLVISTTNLCPCGDWVPQAKVLCGRSLKKCQSYMERLSGPLVDRFQTLFFTQKRERGGVVAGQEILKELEAVRQFRIQRSLEDPRFKKVAGRWTWDELTSDLSRFYMQEIFPRDLNSRRRDLATLRVARSYADLDQEIKMSPRHVERALEVTWTTFESIKRLGG